LLPIDWRIRFKLSTLTFKALHTVRPKYLTDLLHLHKPTRSMRSPYTQLLALPRHNLSFGSRAFRISAPKNWNTLPLEVYHFKFASHTPCPHLETILKHSVSNQPIRPPSYLSPYAPLILLETSAVYKSYTYLLTYLLTYRNITFLDCDHAIPHKHHTACVLNMYDEGLFCDLITTY